MLFIDFVLFLKGHILKEFQSIEQFIIFRKKAQFCKKECMAMFPKLPSIETRRKRLDFMKNRVSLAIKETGSAPDVYINNSLHLARKYARIFVRGHYLFREANGNSELRGTDNRDLQI